MKVYLEKGISEMGNMMLDSLCKKAAKRLQKTMFKWTASLGCLGAISVIHIISEKKFYADFWNADESEIEDHKSGHAIRCIVAGTCIVLSVVEFINLVDSIDSYERFLVLKKEINTALK